MNIICNGPGCSKEIPHPKCNQNCQPNGKYQYHDDMCLNCQTYVIDMCKADDCDQDEIQEEIDFMKENFQQNV